MIWFLNTYSVETPGTLVQSNTTLKLGPKSEVQPNSVLLIEPEFGGRADEDAKGCTVGGPELVVEIGSSSLPIDLNAKRWVYEEAGALEYVVCDEPHRAIHWFIRVDGRFEPLKPDAKGRFRAAVFPGLWLDAAAFVARDRQAVLRTLRLGLRSPGHRDFVGRLRQNRANRT